MIVFFLILYTFIGCLVSAEEVKKQTINDMLDFLGLAIVWPFVILGNIKFEKKTDNNDKSSVTTETWKKGNYVITKYTGKRFYNGCHYKASCNKTHKSGLGDSEESAIRDLIMYIATDRD